MSYLPSNNAAGLEVDSRPIDQSEKIANGGHVITGHNGPGQNYPELTSWYSTGPLPPPGSKYTELQQPKQSETRGGLGGAVLWLSIALAVALVLAVVAAGVGGSLAASRNDKLASCNANNEALQQKIDTTPTSNATTGNSTSCDLSAKPTSDCEKYPKTFTSYDTTTYNISCGQDLHLTNSVPDIMGIFVRSLKDCISACSSFNRNSYATNGTCYAVSVNWNINPERGNCWLKSVSDMPLTENSGVDSAVITEF